MRIGCFVWAGLHSRWDAVPTLPSLRCSPLTLDARRVQQTSRQQHGPTAKFPTATALVASMAFVGVCRRRGKFSRRDSYARPQRAMQTEKALEGANYTPKRDSLVGVVLLNIGTPVSTSVDDVRIYLSRFLRDKPVIDIEDPKEKEAYLQRLLEAGAVKSAEGYKRIWDPTRGSPLLFHTEDLVGELQKVLGANYEIRIGFQYSEPSVETAITQLTNLAVDRIILVPMFPHFAQATVGAFLTNMCSVVASMPRKSYLQVVPPFYKNSGYLEAVSAIISEHIGAGGRDVDHLVFSYHGIPERQCTRTDESGKVCMQVPNCCSLRREENQNCYRAQCLETTESIVKSLGIPDGHWSMSFSSRVSVRSTNSWITPHTDELLSELASSGKRRVAICAPSYTVDSYETLGELGTDVRDRFLKAGGEDLLLIPCINGSEVWARNLASMIQEMPQAGDSAQMASGVRGYWAM